jgi:galactokinase
MNRDFADRPDLPPELRLVPYAFGAEYGHPPAGVWHSPGVVTLLRDGDATLSVAARWGAIVAAEPRQDGLVELAWMNRPAERLRLPVTEIVPGAGSARDAAALGPVWALREAGHPLGGVTLLVSVDLPVGSGLAAATATACAVAIALRDLFAPSIASAALAGIVAEGLRRFGVAEVDEYGRCATALLGAAGRATLWRAGDVTGFSFDSAAAGLRLMVVDTRVRDVAVSSAASVSWGTSGAERADLDGAVAALSRGAAALGPLLTAAHTALHRADVPDDAQHLAVTAALDGGALGARMIWDGPGRPVCVLQPAEKVGQVRTAIGLAYQRAGRRTPRFLTLAPARGARRA